MTIEQTIKRIEAALTNAHLTQKVSGHGETEACIGLYDATYGDAQLVLKAAKATLKMLRGEAWWPIESVPSDYRKMIIVPHKRYGIVATYRYTNFKSFNPTHWRPLDDAETIQKLMEEL